MAKPDVTPEKVAWVADFLHGSIPLFPIEKAILSTTLFNRLHNILQNSTVYFTYPSNRTSRLSHSLGCMHLAGEVFRNGIVNASKADRNDFLHQAETEVQKLQPRVQQQLRDHISRSTAASALKHPGLPSSVSPFLSATLVHGISTRKSAYFSLLLQSVRLAALMHDIGHPPFSHITEFALQGIYEHLKDTLASNQPSPFARGLHEQLTPHLDGPKAFHEALGCELVETILKDQIRELAGQPGNPNHDHAVFNLLLVKEATLAILNDATPFWESIHKILDGALDADRMDYVQRDLIMSGFSREPLRLDRLIRSFTLVATGTTRQQRHFQFMPSTRALHNVEEFFRQRFQLYRYVIYHHRVIKVDGLLERVVKELGIQHIRSHSKAARKASPTKSEPFLLPQNAGGLWAITDPAVRNVPLDTESCYIQWDDSWLLGVLRHEYFRLRTANDHSTSSDNLLLIRLEELLSNRRHYWPLFKRPECFGEIDREFAESLANDPSWQELEAGLDSHFGPNAKPIESVERDWQALKTFIAQVPSLSRNPPWFKLVERHGYALSLLCHILHAAHICRFDQVPFVEEAISAWKADSPFTDAVLIPKRIKTGVDSAFTLVDSNGKVTELGMLSRIADELRLAALLFPPFFVFVAPGNSPTHSFSTDDFQARRKSLGRALANSFKNFARKLTNA
jgi:HD superfamily phosphohydrolase